MHCIAQHRFATIRLYWEPFKYDGIKTGAKRSPPPPPPQCHAAFGTTMIYSREYCVCAPAQATSLKTLQDQLVRHKSFQLRRAEKTNTHSTRTRTNISFAMDIVVVSTQLYTGSGMCARVCVYIIRNISKILAKKLAHARNARSRAHASDLPN